MSFMTLGLRETMVWCETASLLRVFVDRKASAHGTNPVDLRGREVWTRIFLVSDGLIYSVFPSRADARTNGLTSTKSIGVLRFKTTDTTVKSTDPRVMCHLIGEILDSFQHGKTDRPRACCKVHKIHYRRSCYNGRSTQTAPKWWPPKAYLRPSSDEA
jgi:hypothetical protein